MIDDFTLIGNDVVNPPIVEPEPILPDPIPDGELIKSLTVNDSNNYSDWSIQYDFNNDTEVFGDRPCKFIAVPEMLVGSEWIRTACDSKLYKDNEASFVAGKDITAFVALDTRVEPLPAWLSDWTKTDMTLTDDGKPIVTYRVYMKDFKAGETVSLGMVNMSAAVNYAVFAKEYDPNAFKEPVEFIHSDINGDNRINIFDMILIKEALTYVNTNESSPLAGEREKLAADMNDDGAVTINDAIMI